MNLKKPDEGHQQEGTATMNETEGQNDPKASNPKNSGNPSRPGLTFAEAQEKVVDLADEILKVLPRSRAERVTCRRITGNYYRCNWWAPEETDGYDNPRMTGMTVTTHRIHKSQMLHVTRGANGLDIRKPARS